MDDKATLDYPLEEVFGHLATPRHLGDWLPQAGAVQDAPGPVDVGHAFRVRLSTEGQVGPAQGELIAYEPPSSVAYRMFVGPCAHLLRVTCTNAGPVTKVHVHQPDQPRPLLVDLARLGRALQARVAGAPSRPAPKGKETPA
jgi:Polyketide cyclase / dehydrase and lipid transport